MIRTQRTYCHPAVKRQDIQILRGIAVLMVLLFHLQVPGFKKGFLGVDLFFVISGYLMAQLYDKGTVLDFYRRRIDRLLPAYALTVIAVLMVGSVALAPVDFGQLADQALASVPFADNFYFWSQNSYFDKTTFNPLLNLWSLSVEVQFYLIVPLLYPLVRRRPVLFWLVLLTSFAACGEVQTILPRMSFFLMPFRVWEFLAGAGFAWFQVSAGAVPRQRFLPGSVALAVVVLSIFVLPLTPDITGSWLRGHPALPALVIVTATACVIGFGMPQAIVESRPGRILAVTGDASYSIYLVHFPLIVLWNYRPFGGTRLQASGIVDLSLLVLAIALVSLVSYRLAEKAFARRFKSAWVAPALLMLILPLAGLASRLNLARFDEVQRNISAAWTDRAGFRCGKLFFVVHRGTPICAVTASATAPRVLLLGNSHADSIKTTFAEVAQAHGFSVFFGSDNQPLMGGPLTATRTLDELRKLQACCLVLHFSNIYSKPALRDEIETLVRGALRMGIRTAVIAPVPTYASSVPETLYDTHGDPSPLAKDRSQHYRETADFIAWAAKLRGLGVPVYDPAERLCPEQASCRVADADSKPYYFDDGHLTLTGAMTLRPIFDALFDDLRRD